MDVLVLVCVSKRNNSPLPPLPLNQPSLTDLQADAAAWEAAAAAEADTRASEAAAAVAELAARRRAGRAAGPPPSDPRATGSAYGRFRFDDASPRAQRRATPPDPFFGDLDAGGREVWERSQRRRTRRPPPANDTLTPEDAELERLRSAVQAGVARAAAADAAATSRQGRQAAAGRRGERGRAAPPPPPSPDGARSTLFDPRARLAAKVAGVLTLAESIRDGRKDDRWWEEDSERAAPPRRPRRSTRRRKVEDDW